MAKAKKVKEVIEEPKVELPIETIIETPVEEPIVGDEPPSVTLDEVKQVEKDVVQTEEVFIPVIEKAIEQIKEAKVVSNEELTNEEKLLRFLESRDKGEIKLNDFLKSLYGVPKYNEPALWLKQSSSKEIRNMLDKLNKQGDYQVVNGNHLRLGAFYYPDTTTMKTEYHNLNTVPISVVKVN
jgi:hypothetical protein